MISFYTFYDDLRNGWWHKWTMFFISLEPVKVLSTKFGTIYCLQMCLEMLYFHCLWLPYLDLPWFRLRDTYLAPLQSGNLILLTTHYLLHANHHLLLSTHYLLLLGIKIQDGKLWSKWTFLLVLSALVLWLLTTSPICLVKTCGSNSRNRHIIWNLASALWYY